MSGATRAPARGVTDVLVGSGALLGLLSELEFRMEIERDGRCVRIDRFFSRMLASFEASQSPACAKSSRKERPPRDCPFSQLATAAHTRAPTPRFAACCWISNTST